jgi:DnaJ family protein C protein 14
LGIVIFPHLPVLTIFFFLIDQGLATLIAYFLAFVIALFVVAVLGVIILWFYGSFWTTAFFLFLGGDFFVSVILQTSSGCFYFCLFLQEFGYT